MTLKGKFLALAAGIMITTTTLAGMNLCEEADEPKRQVSTTHPLLRTAD